jgi:hypothetical protein
MDHAHYNKRPTKKTKINNPIATLDHHQNKNITTNAYQN